MQKFLGLWDIHCGWEFQGSDKKIVPTHDENSIKIALDFAQDFKPDVIVFGGDQINCAPISHWNKSFPGRIGNFTIKDELDYFSDVVLAGLRFKHKVRRIWHTGNHEEWFNQLMDKNPGMLGLVTLESYLQLEKRGFECYDSGEASQVGKLKCIHGDTVPGGVNMARTAALRYGANIRMGHYHTNQVYTLHNPLDNGDVKNVVVVPCLANRGPHYGGNAPNNHVNGFQYGYIQDSGDFNDYTVIIANGQCVVEGMKYGKFL